MGIILKIFKFIFSIVLLGGVLFKSILKNTVFIVVSLIGLFILGWLINFFWKSPLLLFNFGKQIDFEGQTSGGGLFLSRTLKGKKYILFFTLAECKKCLTQLEKIKDINEDTDVNIYAVFAQENEKVVSEISKYRNAVDNFIIDEKYQAHIQAGAYIMPHTVVVDEKGKIIFGVTGTIRDRHVNKIIKITQKTKE